MLSPFMDSKRNPDGLESLFIKLHAKPNMQGLNSSSYNTLRFKRTGSQNPRWTGSQNPNGQFVDLSQLWIRAQYEKRLKPLPPIIISVRVTMRLKGFLG